MWWLIVVLLLAAAYYWWMSAEDFATTQEKANAIYQWFQAHPAPTYDVYRQDLNRASNIVEYEDAMKLQRAGRLTPAAIEATLH